MAFSCMVCHRPLSEHSILDRSCTEGIVDHDRYMKTMAHRKRPHLPNNPRTARQLRRRDNAADEARRLKTKEALARRAAQR